MDTSISQQRVVFLFKRTEDIQSLEVNAELNIYTTEHVV